MIKSTVAFTLSFFLVLLAAATPVTSPTAVHTQPDTNSSVIMMLSPGGSFVEDSTAAAPNGWTPIINEGPFEGYVLNKDIDKGLRVKLGAPIHMQPKSNSGVLTNMGNEDKASITGLHGKWTQISLDKSVTGYIQRQRSTSSATISAPVLQDVPRQQSSNAAWRHLAAQLQLSRWSRHWHAANGPDHGDLLSRSGCASNWLATRARSRASGIHHSIRCHRR